MVHAVKLDVFEGPLDLLLHLVSKERVAVSEISISTITEEYLQALRKMDRIELDLATSFLVLAATLLELKTVKLLPGRGVDDPELAALLEERDHLLHRLIEYSMFKGAAAAIFNGLEANEGHYNRTADVPEELRGKVPDLLENVDPADLAQLMARIGAPKPRTEVPMDHVSPITVSLAEALDNMVAEIRATGTTSFRKLCRTATNRIDIVINFLALLELFKNQSVELEQPTHFSDIVVRWRTPASEEDR